MTLRHKDPARLLFRNDGTPMYVSYDRSRNHPGQIVMAYGQTLLNPRRKAVTARGREPSVVWEAAADEWLDLLGISRRSQLGKRARALFIDAWPAFQDRYAIETRTACVISN